MLKFLAKKGWIFLLNRRNLLRISYRAHVSLTTSFEGANAIHAGSSLVDAKIGFGTFIGKNSKLQGSKIGRFCSIAHNVEVITHTHPSTEFVSSHPAFYSLLRQSGFTYVNVQKFNENLSVDGMGVHSIEVGNDVWIGAGAMLMGGLKIGHGAIVAAGSIVTKDVPPYAIVGGVPARLLRMRFSEEDISYLMQLKWWDRELSWIRANSRLFGSVELLRGNLRISG